MKKYPDFWHVLIGNAPAGFFFGYIFLAYLGAVAMIFIIASTRDKQSINTPIQWSWKFFFADNAARFISGFLLIPTFIRMIYEGKEIYTMTVISFGIGFGFQGLAHLAKGIGLLTTRGLASKFLPKDDETKKDS